MHFWDKSALREAGGDELDCKILYELDCDCRQSSAAIGKKLRVNKNVVSYRINKLVEDKFIDFFYAVVDSPKLGLQAFRIYLKFSTLDEAKRQEVVDFVTGLKNVWWSGSIDGEDLDFGFLVWVKDIYEFRDFWVSFLAKFQERIQKAMISLYTGIYTYANAFIHPLEIRDKPVQIVGTSFGSVEVSDAERRILAFLLRNARAPVVEIAAKLSLSPASVAYALKKLKAQGLILGYRAQINLSKLGYTMYKLNLRLRSRDRLPSLLAYARACPHIVYYNEAIGFADFEVEMFVQKYEEFKALRAELLALAGDTLAGYNHFVYYKVHDVQFYPQ